jgi:hypothetical protein
MAENARSKAPAAEPAAPATEDDRRRFAAMIQQLGSEVPSEREQAAEALSREYSKAEKILEAELAQRKDPEVVARIREIMQKNIVACPHPPLARALTYLLSIQNPGKGWRTFGPRDSNESSITGWAALVLCSAFRAKWIRLPQPIKSALSWLDEATADDGRVGYTEKPTDPAEEGFPAHLSLIPLANLVRLAHGRSPSDAAMAKGARWLEKHPPEWDVNSTKADFTYWALGTMFLAVLDDARGDRWVAWSRELRKQLTGHQVQLKGICRTGSWEPLDFWSESAGRVYVTAMGAIALIACDGKRPRFGSP